MMRKSNQSSQWKGLLVLVAIGIAFLWSELAMAMDKIKVVTTTTDLKALVEAVGGERVEVNSIGRGYEDPHTVAPKPSNMVKLNRADMFVKVGLDLEIWSQLLVDGARNPRILPGSPGYVDASVGTEVMEIPTTKVDRSLGDIHVFGNPHYWLDPLNGKAMVDTIASALAQISPEDAAYFEKNRDEFKKKLDEALKGWLEMMRPYQGTKVVTYHRSWPNFARRFGLEVFDFIEPKPGIPPSSTHLARLIDRMKTDGVKIIIQEPYFDTKISEFVAQKTGAHLLILPPSVEGAEGIKDYFDLFDYNLGKIVSALREVKAESLTQEKGEKAS